MDPNAIRAVEAIRAQVTAEARAVNVVAAAGGTHRGEADRLRRELAAAERAIEQRAADEIAALRRDFAASIRAAEQQAAQAEAGAARQLQLEAAQRLAEQHQGQQAAEGRALAERLAAAGYTITPRHP